MALHVSHTITCDDCGTDTGSSHPTESGSIEYARMGEWIVHTDGPNKTGRPYGYALCDNCKVDANA